MVLFRETISSKYVLHSWVQVPICSLLTYLCFSYLIDAVLLFCSTVTIFVWKNIFVFISKLYTNSTKVPISTNNIIAEWIITVIATVTTYSTVSAIIVIHISVLIQFMLKQKEPNNNNITGNYSVIVVYNFINLRRKYYFSKFYFKFGKVYVLKRYIQTNFEIYLITAS